MNIDFHSDDTCDLGDALKRVTVLFPYTDDHSDGSDNTGDALKCVTAFYRIHAFSSCLCTRDVTVCRQIQITLAMLSKVSLLFIASMHSQAACASDMFHCVSPRTVAF